MVVFNATARLSGLSLNAAYSLLTSWSLRLAGMPVVHVVCRAGMSHCVLGTNRRDHTQPPPCKACIAQSRRLFGRAEVRWLDYRPHPGLATAISTLGVDELSKFEYPLWASLAGVRDGAGASVNIPLGRLVLSSLRWALRRYSLPDDQPTRYLLREYLVSAYNIAREFDSLLEALQPQAVLIFNGTLYPEAAARWIALQRRQRVITHEVGFQRFSAFFTQGEATAYPVHIPVGFELSTEQEARLDAYLEERFQGKFTMAGIRFWPEMRSLEASFLEKAARFRQVVAVFTNVIYDTSQVHANTTFPHMFAWLEQVLELIRSHPETLFVIRAHPDEMRPGTAKQSNETVGDWLRQRQADLLPNVEYIDSRQYISSYDLVRRSKFLMVYNSSIGLEASLMGAAVVCGGKARYTQLPTVFFPPSSEEHRRMIEEFLQAEDILLPTELQANARRFLYFQLFRASLPFDRYLEDGPRPGYVRLRDFSWRDLLAQNSPVLQVILAGIRDGKPFLMDEAHERSLQG